MVTWLHYTVEIPCFRCKPQIHFYNTRPTCPRGIGRCRHGWRRRKRKWKRRSRWRGGANGKLRGSWAKTKKASPRCCTPVSCLTCFRLTHMTGCVFRAAFYCMNEKELVDAAVSYLTNEDVALPTGLQVALFLCFIHLQVSWGVCHTINDQIKCQHLKKADIVTGFWYYVNTIYKTITCWHPSRPTGFLLFQVGLHAKHCVHSVVGLHVAPVWPSQITFMYKRTYT